MKITYKKLENKYLFCKDGVYFSLDKKQIEELKKIFNEIEAGEAE